MMEINVDNTPKWESINIPVNTYFMSNDENVKGAIILKVYNGNYVNILNGNETWESRVNFKECIIINKLKIFIEQF